MPLKKSKKAPLISFFFFAFLLAGSIVTGVQTLNTPDPVQPQQYNDPAGNIWGVRENDIVIWNISDKYGLNTIDNNRFINYSDTKEVFEHVGNVTEGRLNFTWTFYNTSYMNKNMSLKFEYTNGTGETFEKIRIYRYYDSLFDYISFPMISFNTTEIGSDGEIWFNFSAKYPYNVRLSLYVNSNLTSSVNHTSLYGKFLVNPYITQNYKEYQAELLTEIMKIEDSPTDNDSLLDIFLLSSFSVGSNGWTFDLPNYLDIGIIVWLLEILGVIPSTQFYLHFPGATRIVTSMVPQILSGNQSFQFRMIELLTLYNIFMLPTSFDFELIENLSKGINSLLGVKLFTVINTTDIFGIEIAEGVIPFIEDMQYGNCSVSLKITWNKDKALLEEMGLYLTYFDIGIQRNIIHKLAYTTMPDDNYSDPQPHAVDVLQEEFNNIYGEMEEQYEQLMNNLFLFFIIAFGVAAGALGMSLFNYFKKTMLKVEL